MHHCIFLYIDIKFIDFETIFYLLKYICTKINNNFNLIQHLNIKTYILYKTTVLKILLKKNRVERPVFTLLNG